MNKEQTTEQAKPATEQQENKHDTAEQNGVVSLDVALKAMQEGKVTHLVDNGEGFALPGIMSCVPYPVMLQTMRAYALPENDEVASMEMLLVNMIPTNDGKWAIRHFRPRDFKETSLWVIDEPEKQSTATQQAAKRASMHIVKNDDKDITADAD